MRLLLLFECGYLYLSSNQIAGFFDHQYLWKKSNDFLDFLPEDSPQAFVTSGATPFG